jgi:hypothetical protein
MDDIHDYVWMLEHSAKGHPVWASRHSLGHWQERIDHYWVTGNRDRTKLVGLLDQLAAAGLVYHYLP